MVRRAAAGWSTGRCVCALCYIYGRLGGRAGHLVGIGELLRPTCLHLGAFVMVPWCSFRRRSRPHSADGEFSRTLSSPTIVHTHPCYSREPTASEPIHYHSRCGRGTAHRSDMASDGQQPLQTPHHQTHRHCLSARMGLSTAREEMATRRRGWSGSRRPVTTRSRWRRRLEDCTTVPLMLYKAPIQ